MDISSHVKEVMNSWKAEIKSLRELGLINEYPTKKGFSVGLVFIDIPVYNILISLNVATTKKEIEKLVCGFCEETGANLFDKWIYDYSKIDQEKIGKNYVESRKAYFKENYNDTDRVDITLKSKESLYLFNLFIFFISNIKGNFRSYTDWVVSNSTGSNQANINKYISLTKKDLREGNISVCMKRTLSFLAYFKYKAYGTFERCYGLKLEEKYLIRPRLNLVKSNSFDRATYEKLNKIFSKIILAIDNDKYTEFFYKLDPGIFSSTFLTDIVSEKIKNRKLTEVKFYLDELASKDSFNPSIQTFNNEYNRLINIDNMKEKENIDLEELNNLSGIEFEDLLINKFKSMGFEVLPTPVTGDYGADIIVKTKMSSVIIVQCKRYRSKVNLKAVQEVMGAMAHYSGDYGLVITNSTFLRSAKNLAESSDLELWGQDELAKFLMGDTSFSVIHEL